MKNYRTLLMSLIGLSILSSCHFYKIPKLAKQGEVSSEEFHNTTPFEFNKNQILVEVIIEGSSYSFIFDTGAELNVIGSHLTDKINFKSITSDKVKGVHGKSDNKMHFVKIPEMSIAGTNFRNTGAIIADISHLNEHFGCKPIGGLIGNNLMRKAAWQINYQNQELSVSDKAEKFEFSADTTVLKMDAGKIRNVFFDVNIDSVSTRFIFDTGNSGSINSDSTLLTNLLAKNKDLQYTSETGVVSTDLNGHNFGTRHSVLTNSINIEGLEITDQIISLSGNSSSLIGNGIWKNYTVTIDWEGDVLILDPSVPFSTGVLKAYTYSFRPNFQALKVEINSIQEGFNPEDEIGIGTQVLKINGKEVSGLTLDELCLFWETESDNFKNSESIDLVLLVNGKEKNIQLENKILLPK